MFLLFFCCSHVYPAFGSGVVHPTSLQSKAFLSENPQLCSKLAKAVSEKLAAGDTAVQGAETGDVPSDPPSVIAASEDADAVQPGVGGQEDESSSSPPEGSVTPRDDGSAVSSAVDIGAGKGEEGILLEPGVASVEELFERNTFRTEGQKEGEGGG